MNRPGEPNLGVGIGSLNVVFISIHHCVSHVPFHHHLCVSIFNGGFYDSCLMPSFEDLLHLEIWPHNALASGFGWTPGLHHDDGVTGAGPPRLSPLLTDAPTF